MIQHLAADRCLLPTVEPCLHTAYGGGQLAWTKVSKMSEQERTLPELDSLHNSILQAMLVLDGLGRLATDLTGRLPSADDVAAARARFRYLRSLLDPLLPPVSMLVLTRAIPPGAIDKSHAGRAGPSFHAIAVGIAEEVATLALRRGLELSQWSDGAAELLNEGNIAGVARQIRTLLRGFDGQTLSARLREEYAWALKEVSLASIESAASAVGAGVPQSPSRRKKSHGKGGARLIINAGFAEHHQYSNGKCENFEPIHVKRFAAIYEVSPGSVSAFLGKCFGDYDAYVGACEKREPLERKLTELSGEVPDFSARGRNPAAAREGGRDEDD
jgi:hypothetical protein